MTERLIAAAIVRDGVLESRGFRSHADIRRALGDVDPYEPTKTDDEGFLTSTGRFVDRNYAAIIGHAAGQCSMAGRLLSSEVNWDSKPAAHQKSKRSKPVKRMWRP